jgi:hypothetical protein
VLELARLLEHRLEPGVTADLGVVRDALAQRLRLAHVERLAAATQEQIDPRLVRQLADALEHAWRQARAHRSLGAASVIDGRPARLRVA